MITLGVMVLGLMALGRLGVDLLPQVIYPDIGIRVIDPGISGNADRHGKRSEGG